MEAAHSSSSWRLLTAPWPNHLTGSSTTITNSPSIKRVNVSAQFKSAKAFFKRGKRQSHPSRPFSTIFSYSAFCKPACRISSFWDGPYARAASNNFSDFGSFSFFSSDPTADPIPCANASPTTFRGSSTSVTVPCNINTPLTSDVFLETLRSIIKLPAERGSEYFGTTRRGHGRYFNIEPHNRQPMPLFMVLIERNHKLNIRCSVEMAIVELLLSWASPAAPEIQLKDLPNSPDSLYLHHWLWTPAILIGMFIGTNWMTIRKRWTRLSSQIVSPFQCFQPLY